MSIGVTVVLEGDWIAISIILFVASFLLIWMYRNREVDVDVPEPPSDYGWVTEWEEEDKS